MWFTGDSEFDLKESALWSVDLCLSFDVLATKCQLRVTPSRIKQD